MPFVEILFVSLFEGLQVRAVWMFLSLYFTGLMKIQQTTGYWSSLSVLALHSLLAYVCFVCCLSEVFFCVLSLRATKNLLVYLLFLEKLAAIVVVFFCCLLLVFCCRCRGGHELFSMFWRGLSART